MTVATTAAGQAAVDAPGPRVKDNSSQKWNKIVAPYKGADTWRSVVQLSITVGLFAASWAAMYWSLSVSYWLTLLLSFPTAGFLVRLFMIQHDCGHGSYFKTAVSRDTVGFLLGVLTLTPYAYWRKTHAYHHSHSGDLDFRGFGDIRTLTVEEYKALPRWDKFGYRMYRNPVVMLTVGAMFHFLIKHRYPWDIPRDWKREWRSVWFTNLALVGIVALAWATIGLNSLLRIQIPVSFLGAFAGVLLFYIQHQYEDSYWHHHKEWDYFEAALYGSSHLVMPRPLQWLTASIGIHHVHHLSSQIPNYKLEKCLNANPELQVATKLRMLDIVRLFKLTLWDEAARRMISFREYRRMRAQAA